MADREARYGLNLYRVDVNRAIHDPGSLYVQADSLTVTSSGALILAAEVEPVENLEEDDGGGITRKPGAVGIDVPPVAVFAPGYWYAAIMVDDGSHTPTFIEDSPEDDR